HLDSQDGALQRLLGSSRPTTSPSALAPRSGLERSDFVFWPISTNCMPHDLSLLMSKADWRRRVTPPSFVGTRLKSLDF
ncbi:MAG: hypothetical protein E6833_39265, partial [Bradyrhizobium sp.]|nr:hypothetical protein [Bradyrhizobium sp.]